MVTSYHITNYILKLHSKPLIWSWYRPFPQFFGIDRSDKKTEWILISFHQIVWALNEGKRKKDPDQTRLSLFHLTPFELYRTWVHSLTEIHVYVKIFIKSKSTYRNLSRYSIQCLLIGDECMCSIRRRSPFVKNE